MAASLTAVLVAGPWVQAEGPSTRFGEVIPAHYDIRVHGRADLERLLAEPSDAGAQDRLNAARAQVHSMREAASKLRAVSPGVDVKMSPLSGSAEVLTSARGRLTGPAVRGGREIARDFLLAHNAIYGLSPAQVDELRFLGDSVSPRSGLRMVRFEQMLHGLPVFQSDTRVILDRDGRVVRTVGRLVPGLDAGSTPLPPSEPISPAEALAVAMATVGLKLETHAMGLKAEGDKTWVISEDPGVDGPVRCWMVYFPLGPGLVVPGWAHVTHTHGAADWYTVVESHAGTLLYRKNIRDDASTEEARFSVFVQADGTTPADSPAPQSPTHLMPGDGTQFSEIARGEVLISEPMTAPAARISSTTTPAIPGTTQGRSSVTFFSRSTPES